MEKKKYIISDKPEDTIVFEGHTLHRIIANRNFTNDGTVYKGDYGGFVESESNLSQEENCWITSDAKVFEDAVVKNDALINGEAVVKGHSVVSNKAWIYGHAIIDGYSRIGKAVAIRGYTKIRNATLRCSGLIEDNAVINGEFDERYDIVKNVEIICPRFYMRDSSSILGYVTINTNEFHMQDNACVLGGADFSKTSLYHDAILAADTIVNNNDDYFTLCNQWSSNRLITYTPANKKWATGCFYGTGRQLIGKAYKDDYRKGQCFEKTVRYVESVCKTRKNQLLETNNPLKWLKQWFWIMFYDTSVRFE